MYSYLGASLVAQQVKNLPANAGDMVFIPGLGRFPGEENGTHSSFLAWGNPMDRGIWWATVHRVARVRRDLVTKHHHHHPHLFFFSFIFISWRLITLQYCSGFCHTLT